MNISTLVATAKSIINTTAVSGESAAQGDYDLDLSAYDYDSSWAEKASEVGKDPISQLLKTFQKPEVMGGIEAMLKDSWKFIRLADDLHDIRAYLNDMRICFVALTISGYVGILFYLLFLCVKRCRRKSRRNRIPEYNQSGDCEQGSSPENFKYAYSHPPPSFRRNGSASMNSPDGRVRHPILLTNNVGHRTVKSATELIPKHKGQLEDIEHV